MTVAQQAFAMPEEAGPPGSDLRTGTSVEALRNAVLAKLAYAVGKTVPDASQRDWFLATA